MRSDRKGVLGRCHLPPLALICVLAAVFFQAPPGLEARERFADATAGVPSMSVIGMERQLADILRNHYAETYGNSLQWDQLKSLRISGFLEQAQQSLAFRIFKRKPNLFKRVSIRPDGSRVIESFDGQDAWRVDTQKPDAEPEYMPAEEALNFTRDAPMSGHLLYPRQPGKTISLIGKAEVNGLSTYHLKIELPRGQIVESFLDTETYAEVRQIFTNNVTGKEEITDLSDFRKVGPLRVAYENQLSIDGELVHRIKVSEVEINPGVMTWLFERPEREKEITEAAIAAIAAKEMPELLTSMDDQNDPFARALNATIAESSTFSSDSRIQSNDFGEPSAFGEQTSAQESTTSFFVEPRAPAFSN